MGIKFAWAGVALTLAVPVVWSSFPAAAIVGSVLLIIGAVLICLDK